jgi:hypothetical protein
MGYMVKRMAITKAKTAITIQSSKKIISRKRVRTLLLMISAAKSPIDLPLALREITRAPKSWTAPKNIEPKNTQIAAGTHPQIIAMAGPTIGPRPAMEVK